MAGDESTVEKVNYFLSFYLRNANIKMHTLNRISRKVRFPRHSYVFGGLAPSLTLSINDSGDDDNDDGDNAVAQRQALRNDLSSLSVLREFQMQ